MAVTKSLNTKHKTHQGLWVCADKALVICYTKLESATAPEIFPAIEQIGLNCETKWFKFLGMHLDDKLSWEDQHAHVYQKAAAGTFMLACLKRTVPCRIRLMIYNSLVRPYFEYCIEVWGCSKASDLKVFFKLQKMCVRHISGAGYRSHTDPLFASNKILKIEDLVKYKLLTLAHQAFYASRPLLPIDEFVLHFRTAQYKFTF